MFKLKLMAVFVLIGCMGGVNASAQSDAMPGELLGYAFYTQAGETDLKDPETPGQAGTVTLHELTACLPVPVYQRDGWQGLAGPLLEWHRFDFAGLDGLEDLDLYSVALLLGAVYNGLEHWEFTASAMPGFYTDFRKTDRDDFKTMFHGQAAWWVSGSLQLVLGAAYDSALGDDEFYPVGGLRWDPLPQWSFRLMFPEPMVVWMPVSRLAFYLHALPAGGKWNMRDSAPEHKEYDFRTESLRVGGGCELLVSGPFRLHLSGGMDFDRKYKIEGQGDDYLLRSDVDDTWYVRAGLAVR